MITGGKPREVFDRWQWSTAEGSAILKPSGASEPRESSNWQARVMLCGAAGAGKDTVADMLQARARRRARPCRHRSLRRCRRCRRSR